MKTGSYHVTIVSHTHWDREWYRPFQTFRLQLVELIDNLLDILAHDSAYRSFLLDGQTIVLEDYLEMRPEREADLRRLIQEKRLLIGPWHILPDEFLVGAESTVRNLMLGARLAEDFGGRMAIGYTPDPFGHISQLPQIMAGVDIDAIVFQRGLSEYPTELQWEAPDGTRLLTIYLRTGYGNLAWAPTDPAAFARMIELQIAQLTPHSLTPHVLLLNGTDHMLPQVKLPTLIKAANDLLGEHITLEHGSLPEYVAGIRASLDEVMDLPIISGEQHTPRLFPVLPGVFSARMWIKQRNFACEHLLTGYAEPLNAITRLLGGTNHRGELWRAWRYLIENHPHDSICGCSIDQVHEEMRTRFDWTEQIADGLIHKLLRFLGGQIRNGTLPPLRIGAVPAYAAVSEQGDNAVLVYNPVPGTRSEVIEVDIPWAGIGKHFELLDSDGQSVPCVWPDQYDVIDEQTELNREALDSLLSEIEIGRYRGRLIRDVYVWIEDSRIHLEMVLPEYHTGEIGSFFDLVNQLRTNPVFQEAHSAQLTTYLSGPRRLHFVAQDVPGPGYRTYYLQPVSGRKESETQRTLSETTIENDLFRVEANTEDGTLTVTDKTGGAVYQGLNRFVDNGDRGDEYNYCPPEQDRVIDAPAKRPVITCVDRGDLGQIMQVQLSYRLPVRLAEDRASRSAALVDCTIVTEIRLTPDVKRVDIRTTVNNSSEDHRLRVHFPTGIHTEHAIVDGHFDRLTRTWTPEDTIGWAEQPVPTAAQQVFTAVQDPQQGFLLAGRGLPEYERIPGEDGVTLALTLLRCVGWLSREDLRCRPGHAGPELTTPGAQCLGSHTFAYSLIPFTDDLNTAARDAYGFVEPLLATSVRLNDGTLPPVHTLLTLEPASLVLTAFKVAENGEGTILRFYNSSEQTVSGVVRFGLPVRHAIPVNLLEKPVGEPLPAEAEGLFRLAVPGKKIVSLLLET